MNIRVLRVARRVLSTPAPAEVAIAPNSGSDVNGVVAWMRWSLQNSSDVKFSPEMIDDAENALRELDVDGHALSHLSLGELRSVGLEDIQLRAALVRYSAPYRTLSAVTGAKALQGELTRAMILPFGVYLAFVWALVALVSVCMYVSGGRAGSEIVPAPTATAKKA